MSLYSYSIGELWVKKKKIIIILIFNSVARGRSRRLGLVPVARGAYRNNTVLRLDTAIAIIGRSSLLLAIAGFIRCKVLMISGCET